MRISDWSSYVCSSDLRPRGAVETITYSLISKLLLSSNKISLRSRSEFEDEMRTGEIVPLDLTFELPGRAICLLQRRKGKPTAAVEDFLAVIREVAGEL